MELTLCPGTRVDLPAEVRELAEAYQSVMMDTEELLALACTLALYPWETEAIAVEIGAYVGQTTVFIAKVLQLLGKRVPILSIDPFERAHADRLNLQGIYTAYLKNIHTNGLEDICLPLVAFSQDAAPVVPAKIGVLVIDGGHHYSVVSKDLELYAPKVLSRGLIFIDDYGLAYSDEIDAVDEYFASGCAFRILHKSYFVVVQRMPQQA